MSDTWNEKSSSLLQDDVSINEGVREHLETGRRSASASDCENHDVSSDRSTYTSYKQDADGNDFLSDGKLRHLALVDASAGGFGSPVSGSHYGAARNGKFYDNGAECGVGDFGSVGGGLRRTAWRFTGDEPMACYKEWGTLSMPSDDTLMFDTGGVQNGLGQHGPQASSFGKWVLHGDFDIQVSFANLAAVSGSLPCVGMEVMKRSDFGGLGKVSYWVCRCDTYYQRQAFNESSSPYDRVSSSDTSGMLRITRTGSMFRAYYDASGTWTQIGTDDLSTSVGTDDVYVRVFLTANGTDGSSDVSGFAVNSGTTLNTAGWHREVSSSSRGTRQDMPESLIVATTQNSIDLIDHANSKLWMRFELGVNNALFDDSNSEPRQCSWSDGVLTVAHGDYTGNDKGGGIVIDFTMDQVRIYQKAANNAGEFYGKSDERSDGAISLRNDSLGFGGLDTSWGSPDNRFVGSDIYRDSGYEYHAFATESGVFVSKRNRWHRQDSPTIQTSKTSDTSPVHAVMFDPTSGELFYVNDTNVMSVDKATWEGVMAASGVFSPTTSKAFSGVRDAYFQYRMALFGSTLFLISNEGVYSVAWPSGSISLAYGMAGSGAANEILPVNSRSTAISVTKDGALDILLVGVDGVSPSVVAIDLGSSSLYGMIEPDNGKSVVAIGV